MPRLYRKAKNKRPEVNPAVWQWLCDENPDKRDERGEFSFGIFMLEGEWLHHCGDEADELRKLWEEAEADVLDYHIAHHPGTRPRIWWQYSAPRIALGTDVTADSYLDGRLGEPRLQVSGAGAAPWDAGFAHCPWFEYGIPTSWVGLDPGDPPRFESEAGYLRRHDLLTAEEKKVLKASDFEHVYPPIPNDEVLTKLAENRGQK